MQTLQGVLFLGEERDTFLDRRDIARINTKSFLSTFSNVLPTVVASFKLLARFILRECYSFLVLIRPEADYLYKFDGSCISLLLLKKKR